MRKNLFGENAVREVLHNTRGLMASFNVAAIDITLRLPVTFGSL